MVQCLVYFRVENEGRKVYGQNCFPVISLLPGIKFVPLRTNSGEIIPESGLFVRIKKYEGQKEESIVPEEKRTPKSPKAEKSPKAKKSPKVERSPKSDKKSPKLKRDRTSESSLLPTNYQAPPNSSSSTLMQQQKKGDEVTLTVEVHLSDSDDDTPWPSDPLREGVHI